MSARIDCGEIDCGGVSAREIIDGYFDLIGFDSIRGWSPEYGYGTLVNKLIDAGIARYMENLDAGCPPAQALRRLAETDAIRLLTVHKAKGLEFELVIFLAVEQQTFWANPDEERAVFFVGISRAKQRLVLTTASTRNCPPGVAQWKWKKHRTPHQEFMSYVSE